MGPIWRKHPLVVVVCVLVVGVGAAVQALRGEDEGPAKPRADVKGPPVSASARPARVREVTTGDTLELSGVGRARLLGVAAPAVDSRRLCFAVQARDFTRAQVEGKRVRFAYDRERTGIDGLPRVYVWTADGRSLNARLLSGGYAQPPLGQPHRHARRFLALAANARAREVGRWGRC